MTSPPVKELDVGKSDQWIRDFLSAIDLGALVLDRYGRVVFINDHLLRLLERSREDMIGSDWMDVVPAAQRSRLRAVYSDAVATATSPGSREDSVITLSGRERRLSWTSVVQRDANGDVVGLAAVAHDVTEARRVEAERALLAAAVEQTADAVVLTDSTAHIVFVNAAHERASGYSREELIGRRPPSFDDQASDPVIREMWTTLGNQQPWQGEMLSRRKNGTRYNNAMTITPVFDANLELSAYVSVQRDVTRLREIEADLALESALRIHLGEASRHTAATATLDEAAQLVCEQLISLPGIDAVQLIQFLDAREARVVAVAGNTPPSAGIGGLVSAELAEQLHGRAIHGSWGVQIGRNRFDDALAEGLVGEGMRAIAYGTIERDGDTVGVLALATRDERSAAAVGNKMPPLVGFGTCSNSLLVERLHRARSDHRLRALLQSTIVERTFRTLFQPIVALASGETIGYEALTRFDSGEAPDVRFAQAWSVGVGAELETATLEAAVEAARQLPAGRWLDLNISPRLLTQRQELTTLLQSADRPIVIEITEHERIADYAELRRAGARLGKQVRIAVDDAGVGIANFSHIIELRPDFVKLDTSLVRAVNADPGRQALVVAMCQFARSSGCHLIAEGVETDEEAATLTQLGVAFAQGYHLGRPERAGHWIRT